MTRINFAAPLLLALALAACGTAPASPTSSGPASALSSIDASVQSVLQPTSPVQKIIKALEVTGPAQINADLDAATAYAQAQGDILGGACYPALKTWIASLPPLPAGALGARISSRPPAIGAATFFEYARVDRMAAENSVSAWRTQIQNIIASGLPPTLMLGCGGLMQDEAAFAARVAALIGAGAATADLAPLVPAVAPLLPIPLQ